MESISASLLGPMPSGSKPRSLGVYSGRSSSIASAGGIQPMRARVISVSMTPKRRVAMMAS
eukprot:2611917-Prymnesium_polylepis.1